MAGRGWSLARIEEIQRLIGEGLSDRQIARTLHCRRTRIREVRELGARAGQTFAIEHSQLIFSWAAANVRFLS